MAQPGRVGAKSAPTERKPFLRAWIVPPKKETGQNPVQSYDGPRKMDHLEGWSIGTAHPMEEPRPRDDDPAFGGTGPGSGLKSRGSPDP